MKQAPEILRILQDKFADKITKSEMAVVDPFIVVSSHAITEVCSFLKNHEGLAFDTLMCLSGVDYKGSKNEPDRIEVVYHLFSMKFRHKIVLKVQLARENPSVPTVESV